MLTAPKGARMSDAVDMSSHAHDITKFGHKPWAPSSWRDHTTLQQPDYDDPRAEREVLDRLRYRPPIVPIAEVVRLKEEIAQAARGEKIIIQGGDCAERFDDCNSRSILRRLKVLLQMSLVINHHTRLPTVRIGRFAGQYGKPRSSPFESVDGERLPSFRGENVNGFERDPASRRPDPTRLETGYFCAATTMNFVRALNRGGFMGLDSVEEWRLDFIPPERESDSYRMIATEGNETVRPMVGRCPDPAAAHHSDFYISHEALLLGYEEALTRHSRKDDRWYNLGTHFLWIGDRTRHVQGGHVEYCRGLANPIGIKVGPMTPPASLSELLYTLNPYDEPGRITLITRLGAHAVEQALPPLVRAVRDTGHTVTWLCDPMHGNTFKTESGFKTRSFDTIVRELEATCAVHESLGSILGGVHFELTADDVTECTGGMQGITDEDLGRCYESGCDPRLNYAQSMEMAFLVGDLMRRRPRPRLGT